MVRKVYWFVLFLTFALFACNKIEPKISREVPQALISKTDMVELVYQTQLIQSAYKGRSHNDTNAMEKRDARMLNLLQSNNISQEQFESSLAFYHKSPKDMGEIYEKVITKLNLKIARLEEKMD